MIASRRSTSRAVLAMALAIALCVLAVSCSSDTGNSDSGSGPTAAGQSWSFTDDRGIRHTLPAVPKTIAAQSGAAGALWEYGIVVDGVFGPLRRTDGMPHPAIGLADPDDFESLGEVDSEINLEALAALRPDIIVTSMWGEDSYWGIADEEIDEVEKIAPIVGIRVDNRTLDEPLSRYAELAGSLGGDEEKIDAARESFETASNALSEALDAKPGLRFAAASGTPTEMYVAHPPSFADLAYYQKLGMDLVEPESHPTGSGSWETLSWEQADKYPTDVILADSRAGTRSEILDFLPPTAKALPAVKADQVVAWKAAQAYGYGASARIVEELAAAVQRAERTSAS